jgi:hypothetical protein
MTKSYVPGGHDFSLLKVSQAGHIAAPDFEKYVIPDWHNFSSIPWLFRRPGAMSPKRHRFVAERFSLIPTMLKLVSIGDLDGIGAYD